MNFQKTDCFGPPPSIVLELLVIALVIAGIVMRLWRQGFVVHAAFAIVLPSAQVEAMALEMVLTGVIQFICLAACLTHAYWKEEFTPTRIRLGGRTVPPRGPGYSATSASSA